MIKKIFTSLLVAFFLLTSSGIVNAIDFNADNSIIFSEVVSARSELKGIKNGSKLIKSVDKLVKKIKTNKKALLKLSNKISASKEKLKNENSSQATNLIKVLNYLAKKIEFELYNLNKPKLEELLKNIDDFNSSISTEEKKKVDDKLVELQLNIIDKSASVFQNVLDEVKKLSNREEKGDFNVKLNIDENHIGKIKSEFGFHNYTVKSSNFDSQINGHLKALVDATPLGQDAVKLELEGLIDFISKDGNMYLLLEKFKVTSKENVASFEEFITKLEDIAKQNKYIKFEDTNSKIGLEILKSLTPNKILADGRVILSKPFFKPYKKEGDNKYYIVPTKYACDEIKKLANKFDPINGEDCTDSQYENLLKDLNTFGALFIEINGTEYTFGFEGIKTKNLDSIDGYISFTDTLIKEFVFNVIPNQDKFPNEGLSLEYKKSNKLDFNLFADKGTFAIKFNSNLDTNNKFTSIDYSGNIKGYNDNLISSLNLKNKQISGALNYSSTYFKLDGSISGKTNTDNSLFSLKVDYTGKDLQKNINILEGNLNYNNPTLSFTNKITLDELISNLSLSGDVNNSITILGETIITDITEDGEKNLVIKTTGKYEKNYLELNNNIGIFGGMKKMVESMNGSEIKNISMNFNFKSDLRSNKNNINFYFDANLNDNKIIDFEIDNKSKIEYKNTNIIAPTNTINLNEIK